MEAHPETQVWAMIEGVAKQPIGVKASLLDRVAERKPIGAMGGRIGLLHQSSRADMATAKSSVGGRGGARNLCLGTFQGPMHTRNR